MQKTTWKIGELAKQSGITVRTLHHYHQIGLLVPSEYTEAGHRLYTESDASKLRQILSLRQMGLSLKEIQEFIKNPGDNLLYIVRTQLENVKEQIKLKEKLLYELEQLQTLLQAEQNMGADQLLKIFEVIQMNERNFLTEELLDKMKTFRNSLTEEQKLKQKEKLPLIEQIQLEALKKMIMK